MKSLNLAIAGLAIVATAACSTQDRTREGEVVNDTAARVTDINGPSDGEIAKVLMNVNKSEVKAAELAKTRTQNKDVKKFASSMVKEHTGMSADLMKLAPTLKGGADDDSTLSASITATSAAAMSSLKDLKGAKFDRAYLDNQANMHREVLETMDKTLIPAAKDATLKSMLAKARASVEEHMTMANDLLAKIQK